MVEQGKVYCLVRDVPGTNKFEVPEETKQFLRSLQGAIAIISIAGAYRLGKSFFLNRVLLKKKRAFEIGGTINACTKGIWIWSQAIEKRVIPGMYDGKPVSIFVADTEGLASIQADQNHDVKIFALAILTCTHFIYNSRGTIDNDALDKLSMTVQLA